jgi:hypothetical protein
MDLRTAGVADQAGSWDAWEKETPGLRMPFEIDADDLRFPIYPPVIVPRGDEASCWGQPRSNQCGADGFDIKIEYRDPQRPFRPERGTYHFSGYATLLHNDYWGDWLGPMRWIKKVEIDMLKAEAYIRLNQEASAVPLINATRTTYGGLAAVTGTGKVPYDDAPTNTRCTPRMIVGFPPNPAGAWECGDLWEAMKYEKRMEAFCSSVGIPWFDDRGWGDLISGTITQYPVPAEELMILLEEVYTFGGIPGEYGSAPDIVDWDEGGLRPLRLGEVPSAADLRARVELFERWNAADAAAERRGAQMVRR